MAEDGTELPRWGGVTEPMTVATTVVLAILAFVFAARLTYGSGAQAPAARACLAAAMLATGLAALIGAFAHGTGPERNAALREHLWRGALYTTGLVGAASVASVAYFAARGSARVAILAFAGIKLGENKKKGDFSFAADWRQTGIAAVDPNLNDSDFALAELNTRGLKLQARYNFTDFAFGTVTYYHGWNLRENLIGGEATGGNAIGDTNTTRVLQADITVEF